MRVSVLFYRVGACESLKNEKAVGFPSFFLAALLLPPDQGVLIGFERLNSKANAIILWKYNRLSLGEPTRFVF